MEFPSNPTAFFILHPDEIGRKLAQASFRYPFLRHIAVEFQYDSGPRFSLQGPAALYDPGGAVAANVHQFTLPVPCSSHFLVNLLPRFRKLGVQKRLLQFSHGLFLLPSVHLFGAPAPKMDCTLHASN